MTKQLLLRIDPGWPATPLARWALVDENGQLLGEGESEARHWPEAESCSVVLSGGQCLWLETSLPKAARRDESRLLSYALEDRLLEDTERAHMTISHRWRKAEGGERLGVVLVDRERLRQVLAQLTAINRAPQRLCPELPYMSDNAHWQIAIDGDQAILIAGTGNAATFGVGMLPLMLAQQLVTARSNAALPKTVEIRLAAGTKAPEQLAEICADTELKFGAAYAWWQLALRSQAVDLLHGEFATQARTNLLKRFKGLLWLAATAYAVWLVFGIVQVIWSRFELNQINERMERIYLSNFPGSPVVAPAAQMQQQLSLERAKHGLLKNDDMLALLSRVVEVLGDDATGNISELRYADGLLELSLRGPLTARDATLPSRFAGSGLLTDVRNDSGNVRLRVRLGEMQ